MNQPPSSDQPASSDEALHSLFAAVRAEPLDTSRAEFGFETRLLARLKAERAETTGWRELTRWCWRLAPGLAVVTLAFSLWTLGSNDVPAGDRWSAVTNPVATVEDEDFAQWMATELLPPI